MTNTQIGALHGLWQQWKRKMALPHHPRTMVQVERSLWRQRRTMRALVMEGYLRDAAGSDMYYLTDKAHETAAKLNWFNYA